jgi:hypothetical protein
MVDRKLQLFTRGSWVAAMQWSRDPPILLPFRFVMYKSSVYSRLRGVVWKQNLLFASLEAVDLFIYEFFGLQTYPNPCSNNNPSVSQTILSFQAINVESTAIKKQV